jgi:hypothetical protein
MEDYYTVSGKVDSVKFFKGLSIYFQDASTLFVEGSFAKEVLILYKKNVQEGDYLPRAGTIFPKATKLRCKYSLEFMNELALIAENHAEPELCEHLHLYKGSESIIIWYDAFSDEMHISKKTPQEVVNKFCDEIKTN